MSIIVTEIPRQFVIVQKNNNIVLDDPNPNLTPNQVKAMYVNTYPELLNSTLNYKGLVDETLRYEWETIAGTKA